MIGPKKLIDVPVRMLKSGFNLKHGKWVFQKHCGKLSSVTQGTTSVELSGTIQYYAISISWRYISIMRNAAARYAKGEMRKRVGIYMVI